jgi:hypothetical protein
VIEYPHPRELAFLRGRAKARYFLPKHTNISSEYLPYYGHKFKERKKKWKYSAV